MSALRRMFVLGAGLMALSSVLCAQNYPVKPVRLIVPYTPGGSTDPVARLVSIKLSEQLGQPVVVENRAGGGGIVGTQAVAKSPADGYMLIYATAGNLVQAPFMVKLLPYDPVKDFSAIAGLVTTGGALVANTGLPVTNLKELIDYGKRNPGKLAISNSGLGSAYHIAGELLKKLADIDLITVPYKGGGPALTAAVSGEVPLAIVSVATVIPFVNSGKLKLLGMIEGSRYARMPNVPVIGEAVPGYAMPAGWHGILAPAGTPRPIVARLNGEIVKIMGQADVRDKVGASGLDATGTTPEEFADTVRNDYALFGKIMKTLNIQPE
jgi:tripartite-type tricarboxylate transporter receptor subunit TctC